MKETKAKCIAAGLKDDQILVVPCDVTDEKHLQSLVEKTIAQFGKLDILVNNAGGATLKTFEDCSISDFDEMMNLNCRSIVQLTDLCMPHLLKSKGSVIMISSIAGMKVIKRTHFYGVAKAAVTHYAKSLAFEVAQKGVRVNIISPGLVMTPIFQNAEDKERMENFVHKIPIQFGGVPEDIGNLIVFLASDASRYITGVEYNIDGGSMLGMVNIE